MRRTLTPRAYFYVSATALVALTLIVFTGAAVRVTGSGLGCPAWPECYEDGRLVAELESHAWIEFGNRLLTGFVGLAAVAAGLLAFARRPFRRDLAILGLMLPVGVLGQAVLGGMTVWYGLAPGYVMAHYALSMVILVAAGALVWRARPVTDGPVTAGETGIAVADDRLSPASPDRLPPAADLVTARAIWAMFALGGVTIFAGTAATAAGPHAGGSGTGDVVHRLDFKGADTVSWLINRHGVLATALGLLAVGCWVLARRRGADRHLVHRLTRVCVLMALQGALGVVQFQLELPAELVWVHVALATLLWVGIVLAAVQAGSPRRRAEPASAAPAPAPAARGAVGSPSP
jgi:cytochrome c oxidase assembly protein subunit 15